MARNSGKWVQILERYDGSGLSQIAFARQAGIKVATLRYQLQRRSKQAPSTAVTGSFREIRLAGSASSDTGLVVRIDRSGVRVEGTALPAPGWVAAVLRELAAC
jgi:hypothetical protein